MEKEHKCDRAGINSSPIMTRTKFGHGDSFHICYVICEICGRKSKEFTNWGLFDDKTLRQAQEEWDKIHDDRINKL